MKRIAASLLCLAILICGMLSGCQYAAPGSNGPSKPLSGKTTDLMSDYEPTQLTVVDVVFNEESSAAPTDFAVRLFQAGARAGENTLISPVSVLYALSMTANGAKGDTLTQMEDVLGLDVEHLNTYLKAYMSALPEDEKYKLSIANSIWFTDDDQFTVNQDFLQANADFYGAGIYQAPFDDATCKDINRWVENNTDGMIEDILDEIPIDAVMYLVNAMAFDAEWQKIYEENQVRDGEFTTEDGEKQEVELMYSEESRYLEDDKATGFIKPYADSKYAFVALLPNEGVTVAEYLASMTGEGLAGMLASPQDTIVSTAIPKFECEYSAQLSDILVEMGMPDAFNADQADFSGLGTSTAGNIFISRVLHKTFISVDEKGTKAGAATVVEMKDESAPMVEDPKEVILDRPFIYMLIDCEANLPLFIGTMMTTE